MDNLEQCADLLRCSTNSIAFTGAGVSTFSGIPDFRGTGGLYSTFDADKIFDINWFHTDPAYFYSNMKDLLYNSVQIEPSLVHLFLKQLEKHQMLNAIVTQNIDSLHTRAGSKTVYEIHGSPEWSSCTGCGRQFGYDTVSALLRQQPVPVCDVCDKVIKPNITFFGEMLPEKAIEQAVAACSNADVLLVLGSSLVVYPAAQLPAMCLRNGGKLIIVNTMPTQYDKYAAFRFADLETFCKEIEVLLFEG